ncbi:hypothetical protein [Allonocardiopsis opalescens]|uniref:Uncharacterized protein n=1 Tax=Allonocardiopsis opalescens TaxID=1144618 RepID=A0A2T0PM84_9ACTN|nr:hypothetical protein [Allonocardiopsis opalescens]PRX90022.1 hypothetical protein CLV72_11912 [Allonocardiopsis opalescens]
MTDAAGDPNPLSRLPTEQLHDRAMRLAARRLDAAFLWKVLRSLPAAEATTGNIDRANADTAQLSTLISDFLAAGEGDIGEVLRPLYIDYLTRHSDDEPGRR